PFDIWATYPKEDSPAFDVLTEEQRLAMLESDSAKLRADAAAYFSNAPVSDKVRARLIAMARHDPDAKVRGSCWEALQDFADQPEIRRALIGILEDAHASPEEKGGVVVALAQQTGNRAIFQAIEKLYEDPRGRAKALRAMSRSLDRRFA